MTAAQIITQSCSSGIAREKSPVPLLVLIAQLDSSRSLTPAAPFTPPPDTAEVGQILSISGSAYDLKVQTTSGFFTVYKTDASHVTYPSGANPSITAGSFPHRFWPSDSAGAISGHITNVESGNNAISAINFSKLVFMTQCILDDCPISTIDFSGLTALNICRVSNCNCTSLTLTGCTALQYLYCYGNHFNALDLSVATNLLFVDAHGCDTMTSLSVNGCAVLEDLDCSMNIVDSLDLTGTINLTTLNCGFSWLNSINITGCPNLFSVNAEECFLSSISIPAGLSILQVIGNDIDSITFFGHTSLYNLNCSFNVLTYLEVSGCSVLTVVDAQNNYLDETFASYVVMSLDSNAVSNGDLNIQSNSTLSPSGYIAVTNLQGKGWTVVTD